MEPYFLDWLQQIDLSALGDLSEVDWADVATYGTLAVAVGGAAWTSSKSLIQFAWSKVEPVLGFAVSSLVVFSLWYSLLRVHVSVSFNLDKEVFDNLLWLSAVCFTPYYLIRYNLLTGSFLLVTRTLELLSDLLIFSWFPEKAEQNRQKWRNRTVNTYNNARQGLTELWQKGVSAAQASQLPFGLGAAKHEEDDSNKAYGPDVIDSDGSQSVV